ncbi:YybH family protein [Agromyces lapidis]|uniref:YybH family protein n=1 Tax=Agromyces lapidis TaxID=279574 RepID=A0ABV5SRS2_9MICO|nr:nuclear transport factor 2 family protein [Agromyces lapidis]
MSETASERTANWIAGYLRAWTSNAPDDIGALFTDDAVYLTAPDAEPRRGRAAIVAGWVEDADTPGEWSFDWHVVHEASDLAVVQGRTEYPAERDYLNLWVIRFAPDGRAGEFTEWYMPRDHRA